MRRLTRVFIVFLLALTVDLTSAVTDVRAGTSNAGSNPVAFSLSQNYPNPFNPSTTIRFSIPKEARTTLKVYNILGEQVAVILDEVKGPGQYQVAWNAGRLPSGVYVYRLESGGLVETRRLMLLK